MYSAVIFYTTTHIYILYMYYNVWLCLCKLFEIMSKYIWYHIIKIAIGTYVGTYINISYMYIMCGHSRLAIPIYAAVVQVPIRWLCT